MADSGGDWLTVAEFARRMKVERNAVYYALKTGRIERREDKLINWDQASIDWVTRRNPAKLNGKADKAELNVVDAGEKLANGKVSYQEARRIREYYNAKKAELEYQKQTGLLVEVEEVEKDAHKVGRYLRDALMGLPARIASLLAAESKPQKIEKMLKDEFRGVLDRVQEANKYAGK